MSTNPPAFGTLIVAVVGTDPWGRPRLRDVRVISPIPDGVVGAWKDEDDSGRWLDGPFLFVDEGTTWARDGDDVQSMLAAYALLRSC